MTEITVKKYPSLNPATDCCLFRSLRHDLTTGTPRERGTDLYALWTCENLPAFYFRHWLWCDTGSPGICQITSRDEAVLFIRKQFTEPSLFSGWNHKGLYEFLPEVYGKG